MKIYFICLCVIISCGLARATTQTTANQDKPPMFYVESYNVSDTGSGTANYTGWYEEEELISFNGNAKWSNGSGGAGSWVDNWEDQSQYESNQNYYDYWDYQVENTSFYWLPGSWPDITNIINDAETYTTTFPSDYTNSGGYVSTNQPVGFNLEHCDINAPYNVNVINADGGGIPERTSTSTMERRSAQTILRLRTGGKALSSMRNLFGLTGSATQLYPNDISSLILYGYDILYDSMFAQSSGTNIPSQSITIGSYGKLDSSGNVYVALPDNADVDVTPYVAGANYYAFNVSQQQYALVITANSNVLSTATPEFCVGQQVNLQAAWSPSLPSGAQMNYQWIASLDFMNGNLNPVNPDGSYYPYINSALLTNNPTSVWWYDGGYKYVWCNVTCKFSNGQTAAVTGEGNVSIYKPQVQFPLEAIQPFVPMLTNGLLELGVSPGGYGVANFSARITSTTNFQGVANWVQLINRNASYQITSTAGQYWLDNDPFYNTDGVGGTNIDTPVPPGGITFDDNPQMGTTSFGIPYPYAYITDNFQTYLVFKPSDDSAGPSIWVTLGIVNWGWAAYETLNLSLSSTNVISPTYSSSDAFPTWLHTLHNN